jgi:hypothetical protein
MWVIQNLTSSPFKFMIKKLSDPKLGGFLLAGIIFFVLYVLFVVRPETRKEESPVPVTPNVVSVNKISMKLISAHTEGSGYRVEVCYNLPDQRDWQLTYPGEPQGASLSLGNTKVRPVEEGTMYWKYDQNGKITQRCQYLFFAVRIPVQTDALSLTIDRLYARRPGQSDFCLEVSRKMVERNYNVTIDCMKVNGFEGIVYVKFPTDLLLIDPVFKRIFRDMKWDFYHGPWTFTFPVNPP